MTSRVSIKLINFSVLTCFLIRRGTISNVSM